MGDFNAMFGANGGAGAATPSGDPKEKSNKLFYGACATAERVRFESSIRCRSTGFLEGARTGEQVGAVLS